MKVIGDFKLITTKGHKKDDGGQKKTLYRYNSEFYKDVLMWRESKVDAEADLDRFVLHLKNDLKGIPFMQAMGFLYPPQLASIKELTKQYD